jgi:hypothetical protein
MTLRDELINAVITPIDSSKRYRITISNNSSDTLLECEFDQKWLLHPGQFSGLDDTHMPWDIWTPKPLRCDVLPGGAEISFEVDGYQVPSEYDGFMSKFTQFSFRRLRARTPEPGEREERMVEVRLNWVKSRGHLNSQ